MSKCPKTFIYLLCSKTENLSFRGGLLYLGKKSSEKEKMSFCDGYSLSNSRAIGQAFRETEDSFRLVKSVGRLMMSVGRLVMVVGRLVKSVGWLDSTFEVGGCGVDVGVGE